MPLNLSFIKSIHMKRYALAPKSQKPGVVAELYLQSKFAQEYYPRTEIVHKITNDGCVPEVKIEFVTGDKFEYRGDSLNLRQILKDVSEEQTKLDGILLERDFLEEKEEFETETDYGAAKKDAKKDPGKKGGKEDDKKAKKK